MQGNKQHNTSLLYIVLCSSWMILQHLNLHDMHRFVAAENGKHLALSMTEDSSRVTTSH